jgi:hypothetical protein
MKRLVVCQWITFAVCLYVWYRINGGLWPSFLRSHPGHHDETALDVNLIDHFLSAQHDGSLITWTHAANSRESLKQAFTSGVMMIEADVILRGQNTADQAMTPIMARLPDVMSNLTLAEWLTLVKGRRKGLKLDFKSIEAVEISLQRLAEVHDELNAPLHLSAAIIDADPSRLSAERAIDSNRFLRLCMTHAADCTLALGWISAPGSHRYNWTAVKAMHDTIERWQIRQPITFNVPTSHIRRSISQVKWLMEMTPGSTLTVVATSAPPLHSAQLLLDDLVYVRRRLPRHSVFYDVPLPVHVEFNAVKDDVPVHGHPDAVEVDESRSFVVDQWKVVRSRDGEKIYLGTAAVLLQTGVLITRAEYPASPQKPVVIAGRVEFLDEPAVEDEGGDKVKDANSRRDEVGLAVFLRASQSSRPDSLSGIRCFFGVTGEIRIELRRIPGAQAESRTVLPGSAPCIGFQIVDGGVSGITAHVTRPKSCDVDFDLAENVDFEADVQLPMKDVTTEESFIAIKQSIPIGFTAIDQFTIHTKPSSP